MSVRLPLAASRAARRSLSGWISLAFGWFALAGLALPFLLAPAAAGEKQTPEPVELFAALADGALEATVIPRDATQVTLQVKNRTDRPLAIRLPGALAAVPVAAQFGFPFPGGPGNANGNNNNNNGPQALGMPWGNGNGNGNGLNNPFGGPGLGRGIFNVPAGKVIKVKLPALCLEHGKSEPRPRQAYALAPLAEACDDPALPEVLAALEQGTPQRVAQLAAWNITDGLSWSALAGLRIKHVTGLSTPQFTASEVAQARRLRERIADRKDAGKSLSAR